MYFLVNASPPKQFYAADSNFAGAYSYNVDGTEQHFV